MTVAVIIAILLLLAELLLNSWSPYHPIFDFLEAFKRKLAYFRSPAHVVHSVSQEGFTKCHFRTFSFACSCRGI